MKSVLLIGAHPDDIDLGCSFVLQNTLNTSNKKPVYVAIMTNGKGGAEGSICRKEEQSKSIEYIHGLFGAKHEPVHFLNCTDTGVDMNKSYAIKMIRRYMKNIKGDGRTTFDVYFPTNEDSHQDHVATHGIVLAACSNLEFVDSLICYETPSTLSAFSPNYYIYGGENEVENKMSMLDFHASQLHKSYLSDAHIKTLASYRANQCKSPYKYAEAFEIIRRKQDILESKGDF